MDKSEKTILLVVLAVLVGCLCISVVCGLSILAFNRLPGFTATEVVVTEKPVIVVTATATTPKPVNTQAIDAAQESLSTLLSADIPTADLIYIAGKYEGKKGIPLQLTTTPINYQIGDTLDFYKLNTDNNETTKTTGVLRFASDEVYFWVEQGLEVDQRQLKQVGETFANTIYPTDQAFFGKEWIPGVDNDPHLYILYTSDLGTHLAGYHAPSDMVLPQASEYSNSHEMFFINSDVQTLSDPYTLSVMAHELQHLIHSYHDSNEDLWLNEGFSELATLLNGYDAGGFDSVYAFNTDVQLNDWSVNSGENDAHYGASFLYTTYLLSRFGNTITRQVVADPSNGFSSIDRVFGANNLVDNITGKQITADDFFSDWTITNYFLDPDLGDGRYFYSNYANAPSANLTKTIVDCEQAIINSEVKQYGADYYEIACPNQELRFFFEGAPTVQVLPDVTGEGKFMWSNRADTSATSLTREFDFTQESGPITLNYQTWYDLETDYDYVYLVASENGSDWTILKSPSCTTFDPTGSSYGCGYNGQSQRWIAESVDLTKYAGKKITLGFEYVTDAAVTAEGFIVDNISIPEIGYQTDFETNDGGWVEKGFVRIENSIPQTFLVSIVSDSTEDVIQKFNIQSGDALEVVLDPLPANDSYIVIVSGSTRFTRQNASYQFTLDPK